MLWAWHVLVVSSLLPVVISRAPTVALLFLTRGSVPLEGAWKRFLESAAHKEAPDLSPKEWANVMDDDKLPALRQKLERMGHFQANDIVQSKACVTNSMIQEAAQELAASWTPQNPSHGLRNARLRTPGAEPHPVYAAQSLFTLYVHTPPDTPPLPDTSVFFGREIEPSTSAERFTHRLAVVSLLLLEAALLDPAESNARFVTLSEADLPLYNAAALYLNLIMEKRSRVGPSMAFEELLQMDMESSAVSPYMFVRPFTSGHFRKTSQWVTLTRAAAYVAVHDRVVEAWFATFAGSRWRCRFLEEGALVLDGFVELLRRGVTVPNHRAALQLHRLGLLPLNFTEGELLEGLMPEDGGAAGAGVGGQHAAGASLPGWLQRLGHSRGLSTRPWGKGQATEQQQAVQAYRRALQLRPPAWAYLAAPVNDGEESEMAARIWDGLVRDPKFRSRRIARRRLLHALLEEADAGLRERSGLGASERAAPTLHARSRAFTGHGIAAKLADLVLGRDHAVAGAGGLGSSLRAVASHAGSSASQGGRDLHCSTAACTEALQGLVGGVAGHGLKGGPGGGRSLFGRVLAAVDDVMHGVSASNEDMDHGPGEERWQAVQQLKQSVMQATAETHDTRVTTQLARQTGSHGDNEGEEGADGEGHEHKQDFLSRLVPLSKSVHHRDEDRDKKVEDIPDVWAVLTRTPDQPSSKPTQEMPYNAGWPFPHCRGGDGCGTPLTGERPWQQWQMSEQGSYLHRVFRLPGSRIINIVSDECLIKSQLAFYGLEGPDWQTEGWSSHVDWERADPYGHPGTYRADALHADPAFVRKRIRSSMCDMLANATYASAAKVFDRTGNIIAEAFPPDSRQFHHLYAHTPLPDSCVMFARKFDPDVVALEQDFMTSCSMLGMDAGCLYF